MRKYLVDVNEEFSFNIDDLRYINESRYYKAIRIWIELNKTHMKKTHLQKMCFFYKAYFLRKKRKHDT